MEQTPAASSPATDVFNGEQVSLAEFSKYREDGTIPERFKTAEEAEQVANDAPEETAETDEPESDPEEAQEQPQKVSPAEKRIKQLLAEKKELQRKLEAAAKPTHSDSSTAQAPRAPQNYQEYRQAFKPSMFIEEYTKAHPEASYEDANAAMADHLFDVRKHFETIETRVNAEKQALESRVSDARDRYADFDEIKDNFLAKTISDKGTPLIPLPVLSIINDSDVMAHLLYTIGSDEAELAKFVDMAKSNPNKAIRYVTKVESLIAEELAKPSKTPVRGNDGKFAAPEKRQTSAPKPVSPVSGGSSRAFDVNDDSLSPEEWMRQRNKKLGIG
jgi:hypothetical protein